MSCNNPCYKHCRNGKFLSLNSPFYKYQTQKIIQNTVRADTSLYTMNLGALSVYQRPTSDTGVNWNQMSDRIIAHQQRPNPRNSTRLRPGALSPGGIGVDVKHDSYTRYLAKLKGRGPLLRGQLTISSSNKKVQGAKVVKTNIVTGCNCSNDINFYIDTQQQPLSDVMFDECACLVTLPPACICLPVIKPMNQYLY